MPAVLSSLALGLVVYFAVKILLSAPGNVLALVCLVLMGLYIGNLARRGGVRSFAALCALGATLLGVLLAFALGRAG
ncbi:hypothetical protein [Deinococcus sp.]|uniref:hypothetical protein n=1 Tax=Deinococcus sp. TaxID=47478 RepID=UPI003C7CB3A3